MPGRVFFGVAWKLFTGFGNVAQLLHHLCYLIINDFLVCLNLLDGIRSIIINLGLSGKKFSIMNSKIDFCGGFGGGGL